MSRTIDVYKYGSCDVCQGDDPTVHFNSCETGYEGWDIDFEICQKCVERLLAKDALRGDE